MSNNQAQFHARFNEFEADLKNFGRKNEELQLEKIKLSEKYGDTKPLVERQKEMKYLQSEFFKKLA